ncbi:MAG: TssA family type VI secretion system protein [Janthinobacterium lividum]
MPGITCRDSDSASSAISEDEPSECTKPAPLDLLRNARIREGERYAALQGEIGKLTDIHAREPVDWGAVETMAVALLDHEGPDLSAAVWLIAAAFELNRVAGLCEHMPRMKRTVVDHWPLMNPPPERMAGRRNLMLWLIERLGDAMSENLLSELAPLAHATHATLVDDWRALTEFWSSQDPTPPPFQRLTNRFAALRCAAASPVDASATHDYTLADRDGATDIRAGQTETSAGDPSSHADIDISTELIRQARASDAAAREAHSGFVAPLVARPGALAGSSPGAARDALLGQAQALAAAGQLSTALSLLQKSVVAQTAPRERFHLRLAQCELIQRFDVSGDLSRLVAPLLRQVDEHRLEIWEPELAQRTLALAAMLNASNQADRQHLLDRLAAIDLAATWRVNSSSFDGIQPGINKT